MKKMNDKQIIENAPEWADLVTDELLADDVVYYADQCDNLAFELDMSIANPKTQVILANQIPSHNIRSLSDIKTIVKQKQETERLESLLSLYMSALNRIEDYFEYSNESSKDKQKVMSIIDTLVQGIKSNEQI